MTDRVLIPLPGIGTLSLTRAEYENALIPIAKSDFARTAPKLQPTADRHRDLAPPAPPDAMKRPRHLRYIRLREVCQRVGLRQSTIYRLIGLGKFPKQVKLSEHASAWVETEVEKFMAARIAERDQQSQSLESTPALYMRMGEVIKRTGFDSSTIYELIREGNFPKWADLPKIASGWLRSDVEAWLESRTDPLVLKP